MGELFYWLFNMSIVASLAGLIIILLRMIKKIPRRIIVILWAIPLIRFLFPFGVGGRYGLMSLLSRFTTKTVVVYEGEHLDLSMTNSVRAADSYFPITYKVDLLADVFKYASFIWMVIAVAVIIAMTAIYVTTKKELKDAKHLRDNIYGSPKIVSPAVYGIIKPRIIIPDTYKDSADLDMIILHEQRHIKRQDNFWRIVAFVTAAIHWFNPLSWLFLKMYLADTELACDESVLSKLNGKEIKQYAHALLNARESRTVFASSFGGAKLRTRVENIVSYKKMTMLSLSGFIILAAVIAYVLLTNAA